MRKKHREIIIFLFFAFVCLTASACGKTFKKDCMCNKSRLIVTTRGGIINEGQAGVVFILEGKNVTVEKGFSNASTNNRAKIVKRLNYKLSQVECEALMKSVEDFNLYSLNDEYDTSGILEGEIFFVRYNPCGVEKTIFVRNDYLPEIEGLIKTVNKLIPDAEMKLFEPTDTLKRWYNK